MRPDELERRLRERLDALGASPAVSCSTSSCCPTSTGSAGSAATGGPKTRTFAELLFDCEEDERVLNLQPPNVVRHCSCTMRKHDRYSCRVRRLDTALHVATTPSCQPLS